MTDLGLTKEQILRNILLEHEKPKIKLMSVKA